MAGGSVTITIFNFLPGTLSLAKTPSPSLQGTWLDGNGPLTTLPALPPNSSGNSFSGTIEPPASKGATGSFAYTYTSPSGGVTTFQFNFGCPAGANNNASVTATTVPSAQGGFAVPFLTYVGDATKPTYCSIATSGSPVTIEYYLYPRIVSVAAQPNTAPAPAPVLNWDGNPVSSAVPPLPVWTPWGNYANQYGSQDNPLYGSNNPLVFQQTIAAAQSQSPWLRAMVMGDLVTMNQGNQVTLNVTMTEVVSQQPITFQSNVTNFPTPLTVTPLAVDLYVKNPSGFDSLASISTFTPGAVNNWIMHDNTAVGAPQLEIYWLYGPLGPMWIPGGVWVRTLRDIFAALVEAQKSPGYQNPLFTIANNCFIGSTINSPNGSKVYEENGGAFGQDTYNLLAYYNAPKGQTVNCVDQAGFLQVCLGAVGLPTQRLYLFQVGFLTKTSVVGYPNLACNSPDWYIYKTSAAALVPPTPPSAQPNTVPYSRVWWQDHYVVQLVQPNVLNSTAVLDATLGPYVLNNETVYLSTVIDNTPEAQSLYTFWNTHPTVPDIMQNPAPEGSSYPPGPIVMKTYNKYGITPNTGVSPNSVTPDTGVAHVTVTAPPTTTAKTP